MYSNEMRQTRSRKEGHSSLPYLSVIASLAGVAISASFFALYYRLPGEAVDTALFVMVATVVPQLQNCISEMLKLHLDHETRWRSHYLFYLMIAIAAVLAIAAPIVYHTLGGAGTRGEQFANILLLAATLLMCLNGCLGVLDIAKRKDQKVERVKMDEERAMTDQQMHRNALKSLNTYNYMLRDELRQRKAKRRLAGLKKMPKTSMSGLRFSVDSTYLEALDLQARRGIPPPELLMQPRLD